MPYTLNYQHADDIIAHLKTIVPTLTDPILRVKYIGFVAVAAVTVYEMAIKSIFIDFANKKHKVLGKFTEAYFERINGRIKITSIREEYIIRFGEGYLRRFDVKLEKCSSDYMRIHRRDIISSYSNLINWRNDFAHQGVIRTTATYPEVIQTYEDGKEIIRCLAETMTR